MQASVAALAVLLAAPPADVPPPGGLVVEEVQAGFAAHGAGLEPGDLLLGWERAASPPANPEPARGAFTSPFDVHLAEGEEAPRGTVVVSGTRNGEPLMLTMPPGDWKLAVRPPMSDVDREAYERARRLVGEQQHDQAFTLWNELGRAWRNAGEDVRARWLFLT